MRFVDIAFAQEPDGFEAKATAAVANGEANIAHHSEVWRDCKPNLKNASLNKCFYCEMKDERSDGTVDHYRPKSKYTWAAFRFSNFRFACTFCNSRRTDKKTGEIGGKGAGFPLLEGCIRATCEAEEDNEVPLLLDPCKGADAGALDFRSDGMAVPKNSQSGSVPHKRAEASIAAYHLNHSDLIEARRCMAVELNEKVYEAQKELALFSTGNVEAWGPYSAAVRDIQRRISPGAILSVFARRVLQAHKNKVLVDEILATA